MESDKRKKALTDWLSLKCGLANSHLQPLLGDASFRRYFRVLTSAQPNSFIVMDAPPENENCHSFVAIANGLRNHGLQTPEIIHADLTLGFLLLTDFGDLTYLRALTKNNADPLYQQALQTLAQLQDCQFIADWSLPFFTAELMQQEWNNHKEWFAEKLLHLASSSLTSELDHCYTLLVESALTQPQVLMHRDYHSANLMVLPNQRVGILDFQDAFLGPITYDAVSLLRDCYIDWPDLTVKKWVLSFQERLSQRGKLTDISSMQFLYWFDWMGVQRHLKALFTFARKAVRDKQPRYLQYMPRTLAYLKKVTHLYPELAALYHYISCAEIKVIACLQQSAP